MNMSQHEGLSEATQKLMMKLGGDISLGQDSEELEEELKVHVAKLDC